VTTARSREIHLGTTKALRDALIEQRLAEPFEWHEAWVQFSIRSKADAEHALWLFRLAYDRLSGAKAASLKQRVAEYAASNTATRASDSEA
jgi:Family of unknown function (DUF5519)